MATTSIAVFRLALTLAMYALLLALVYADAASGTSGHRVKFKRLSVRQGLPSTGIRAIAQDRHGFMWFATFSVLCRYDGYNFRVFRNDDSDSTSISGDAIRAICPARSGDLLVATGKGLSVFVHDRDHFVRYSHDPNSTDDTHREVLDDLYSVHEDRHGNVWVGGSGGLSVLQKSADGRGHLVSFGYVGAAQGSRPPRATVYAILEDSQGVLWVGTAWGVSRVERHGTRISYVDYRRSATEGSFRHSTLYEDPGGRLWMTGDGGALSWYDRERDSVMIYGNGVSRITSVSQMVRDQTGRLWVGSLFDGVAVLDKENRMLNRHRLDPDDPESIPGNDIRAVCVDHAGNLWFGTRGIGFVASNQSPFTVHKHRPRDPSSLAHDAISILGADREGGVWVAITNAGELLEYLPPLGKGFVRRPISAGNVRTNSLYAIHAHSNGDVWFAGAIGKVVRLRHDNGKFVEYFTGTDPRQSLSSTRIRSIVEDPDGLLWFATAGGVDCYDPVRDRFEHFQHDPADSTTLSGNHAVSLHVDRRGQLWIGTWGQGLNRLDRKSKKVTRYFHRPEDPSKVSTEITYAIAEDGRGDIWLTVRSGGLMRYSYATDRFTQFTEHEGLPGQSVQSILTDSHGMLWLGTPTGLCQLDPWTVTFKTVSDPQGLSKLEFYFGACKTPDGRMFFGSREGLVEFHPDSVRNNKFVPPVVITSFKVIDRMTPFSRNGSMNPIILPYNRNSVSFEFAALDFVAPEMNQYAYKLEGADRDWNLSANRHYASYPHLPPGEYRFRVKGTNSDGVWNESGSSLIFIVAPPFWKTWWFYSLVVALALGGLYTLYRYRLFNALEVERLRMRLAGDLHDELASNLSSIAMSSTMSESDTPERMRETLSRVRTLAEESAGSIRDIIWALDPTTETLHDMLARAKYKLTSLCESRRIELDFSIPQAEALPDTNLSPEARRDLWLLLKEACMNAVKHSGCTRLSIEARFEQGALRLTVSDNGRGFSVKANYSGKGLATMKMRAEQLHGSVVVDSHDGSGTKVVVTARL